MTAYVNEEQKKEGAYGKAVKATLAATLAAGMVPAAAAFADEPQAETASEGDIELLWAGEEDNFKGGEITKVKDQNDKVYEVVDGKVTVKAGAVTQLQIAEFKYADGQVATADQMATIGLVAPAAADFSKAGTYKGFKASETTNSWESLEFSLVVEANELEGVALYSKDGGNTDVTKTGFTYSAAAFNFGLVKDGKDFASATVDGVYAADDTFFKKNLKDAVLPAGSYNVVVKGSRDYAGSDIILSLAVEKFDISKSDLTIADCTVDDQSKGSIISPSKSVPQTIIDKLKATGDSLPVKVGAYSATIASADDKDANIVGTKKVDYVVASEMLGDANVQYGTDDWGSVSFDDVDLSDEKPGYFDASKVVVTAGGDTLKLGEDYELVVTDDEGNAATLDDLKKPGSWLVYVKGIPGEDFAYAGMTETALEVNVIAGELANANLVLTFDEKLQSGDISTEYTGDNILDRISVVVKGANGKELVEGTDYNVVVKDEDGKKVDEIVSVGKYILSVEADGYKITGDADLTIDVTAKTVTKPRLANETVTIVKGAADSDPNKAPNDPADLTGIPYTGSAIELQLEYFAGKVDGKDTYKPLDASEYTYTLKKDGKPAESILEPGKYEVTVKDVKDGNFDVNGTVWLRVIDEKVFRDVPTTEWFYDEVLEAYQNGWVKGYNASDFFGPNDSITRADVCVIAARMAGADLDIDKGKWISGISKYNTPFGDVDAGSYYAQAIAWAANAGIVQGDGDTGNFRPEDEISRSEFAAIMMRYAQKDGDDTVVEDGALDAYADASEVPAWFQGEVAWAVEAGIMGVGTPVLNPNGDISRAEVAAMVVRL